MDDKIFDKINISDKLSSIVDIAIDEGVENLNNENVLKKKIKRKRFLVASAITFICSGMAFSSEEVRAGAISIIESTFNRFQNMKFNNITMINQMQEVNGVKLYLDEAATTGEELILSLRLNHENLTFEDWKIKEGALALEKADSKYEYEKLRQTIKYKIFNGEKLEDAKNIEGIDYTKINIEDIENYNEWIERYTTMYEWGISDEDFYGADSEDLDRHKDRAGAFKIEYGDEDVYSCILDNSPMIKDYKLLINGQELSYTTLNSGGDKREDVITMKFDISGILDEKLDIKLVANDLEIDSDYPVIQKGIWEFNFDMVREINLVENDIEIEVNQNVDIQGFGTTKIENVVKTDTTIKVNYVGNLTQEGEFKNSTLIFDAIDAKTGEVIFKDSSNFKNGESSFVKYENTLSEDIIELKPILMSEEFEIIKEFKPIKINLSKK